MLWWCYGGICRGWRTSFCIKSCFLSCCSSFFFIVSAAMCTPGYLACKHQGGFLSPSSFLLVGYHGVTYTTTSPIFIHGFWELKPGHRSCSANTITHLPYPTKTLKSKVYLQYVWKNTRTFTEQRVCGWHTDCWTIGLQSGLHRPNAVPDSFSHCMT